MFITLWMNWWERDLGLDTNENKNASLSQFIALGFGMQAPFPHQRFPFHCSRRKVAKIQGGGEKTSIFDTPCVI